MLTLTKKKKKLVDEKIYCRCDSQSDSNLQTAGVQQNPSGELVVLFFDYYGVALGWGEGKGLSPSILWDVGVVMWGMGEYYGLSLVCFLCSIPVSPFMGLMIPGQSSHIYLHVYILGHLYRIRMQFLNGYRSHVLRDMKLTFRVETHTPKFFPIAMFFTVLQ